MFSGKCTGRFLLTGIILFVIIAALPVSAAESRNWASVSIGRITVEYDGGVNQGDARTHALELENAVAFLRSRGIGVPENLPFRDVLVSTWPDYLKAWSSGAEQIPWYGPEAGRYVTSIMVMALWPYANSCNILALERCFESELRGVDVHQLGAAIHASMPYIGAEDAFTGFRSDSTAQQTIWMAASFLAFVDAQYGTEKMLLLTGSMRSQASFNKAVQASLGISGPEAQSRWFAFLETRRASPEIRVEQLTRHLMRSIQVGSDTRMMLFDAAGIGYSKDLLLKSYRRMMDLSAGPDIAAFGLAVDEYARVLNRAIWGRRLSFIIPAALVIIFIAIFLVRRRLAMQRITGSGTHRFFFDHPASGRPGKGGSEA